MQTIRGNLDISRPDQISLVFNRQVRRNTPGRFRTRVITDTVTPSLHVDYKHCRIKQYHKQRRALQTETTINDPVTTATRATCSRTAIHRSPRPSAAVALCIFRLLPRGFTNRDLRIHLAPQLGRLPEHMTSGQITYDLRRLRAHGLIRRIPGTHRYLVTDPRPRHALFLTRAHTRPLPSKLRAATRTYEAAIDDLAPTAGLAA